MNFMNQNDYQGNLKHVINKHFNEILMITIRLKIIIDIIIEYEG